MTETLKAIGNKLGSQSLWMMLGSYFGVFLILGLMAHYNVDANTGVGGAALMAVGKFISNWGTGFDYVFGSSASSSKKDETIASVIKSP